MNDCHLNEFSYLITLVVKVFPTVVRETWHYLSPARQCRVVRSIVH